MRLWTTENARNEANKALFRAMILKAYPDIDLAAQKIPSADAMIFDHAIAKAVWGDDWLLVLSDLAALPASLRDKELRDRFNARWLAT